MTITATYRFIFAIAMAYFSYAVALFVGFTVNDNQSLNVNGVFLGLSYADLFTAFGIFVLLTAHANYKNMIEAYSVVEVKRMVREILVTAPGATALLPHGTYDYHT